MKKPFTINLQDNPEYVSFLTKLTEILKNINIAKDKGINVIFYQDEGIYQGKGEYTPLIFEALRAVGCKCKSERTFLGSGLYISWESDDEKH